MPPATAVPQEDPVVPVVTALLGALFGSFANVLIHRWPRGGSVLEPRGSHCPGCGAPVRWFDNVPVVSWLVLRGRCRDCGQRIHLRYPVVELTVASLWGLHAWRYGLEGLLLALLVFSWGAVVAAAIDLEHRIIPNRLTYALAPILAVLLAVATTVDGNWSDYRRAVIAGVAVPAVMLGLSEAFRVVRGQPGIGMGDIKLAVSIGLVVGYLGGWQLVIFAYATVISAVVVVAVLLALGRARLATRIPYGPYLALGSVVATLGGDSLAAVVAGWFGF